MTTIWEVYFLILKPHTQLIISLLSVLSHSNITLMGDQNIKIILVKLLMFLAKKPLNLVIFALIELVIFNLIW